jgi:hypothetical protein
LTVAERDGLAFFYQMVGEAVNATLWEYLPAGFACVLVAIARVFQLGTPVEELEDQLVGFATHVARLSGRVL